MTPHRIRSAPAPFSQAVYTVVRAVPRGAVTSYGAVAALAGSPRAARGVGAALQALPGNTDVPWWRVVNRNGRITIPAELGLRALQRALLEAEEVSFLPSGEVDLERHAWAGPAEGGLDVDGLSGIDA